MSRLLAQLLGKSESAVSNAIHTLEHLSSHPAEDIKLLAENQRQLDHKIGQLGLDPRDTTAEELYLALIERYRRDSQALNRALGSAPANSYSLRWTKAAGLVKQAFGSTDGWSLKPVAVKRILSSMPPRQTMKAFGYRSLPSMLKRENIYELALAAGELESGSWRQRFEQSLAKQPSTSYSLQPAKLVNLDASKLPEVTPGRISLSNRYLGCSALLPSGQVTSASVLLLALLMADSLDQLGIKFDIQRLTDSHPALGWWRDNSHLVAHIGGQPVSLNLLDVATNSDFNNDFRRRSLAHGSTSLWDQLIARYQSHNRRISDILPELQQRLGYGSRNYQPDILALEYNVD